MQICNEILIYIIIIILIKQGTIIIFITNLEYTHDGMHYGKYESEKPPKDNANGSLFFGMSKKEWSEVRIDYFNKLKVLADNFKSYVSNLTQTPITESGISYASYQKIHAGASYDDVVKLLGDEGKELSNSTAQINGKNVSQQTVIWADVDKSKNITISFVDGKVTSKSQNNL